MQKLCLCLLCIGLLQTVSRLEASVLRVLPIPLSDQAQPQIDQERVRVENGQVAQWSQVVWQQNTALFQDLKIQPVATIKIEALPDDMPDADLEQFCQRARTEAAWAGANLVFIDEKRRDSDGLLTEVRFMAYRAEYQNALLSPYKLAALARLPLSQRTDGELTYVTPAENTGYDNDEMQNMAMQPHGVIKFLSQLTSVAGDILTVALLK